MTAFNRSLARSEPARESIASSPNGYRPRMALPPEKSILMSVALTGESALLPASRSSAFAPCLTPQ